MKQKINYGNAAFIGENDNLNNAAKKKKAGGKMKMKKKKTEDDDSDRNSSGLEEANGEYEEQARQDWNENSGDEGIAQDDIQSENVSEEDAEHLFDEEGERKKKTKDDEKDDKNEAKQLTREQLNQRHDNKMKIRRELNQARNQHQEVVHQNPEHM